MTQPAAPEACQGLYDFTGWQPITCEEREALFAAGKDGWTVFSGLTDHEGQFGPPIVFTEWGEKDTERPTLRDYRYPGGRDGQPDRRPCAHYKPGDRP